MNNKIELRNKTNLYDFLFNKNNIKIKIPFYQRDFQWKEKQLQQFIESFEKSFNNDKKIFIGNFLFLEKFDEETIILEIVDGQQRLIAIFLILLTINDLVVENYCLLEKKLLKIDPQSLDLLKKIRNSILNSLFNKSLDEYTNEERFTTIKLFSEIDSQNEIFKKISHKLLTPINENVIILNSFKNSSGERLIFKNIIKPMKAINLELEKANIILILKKDEMDLKIIKNFIKNISDFWNFIEKEIQAIFVEICEEKNAIDIFVNMNSTSKKLEDWDLLKAFLIAKTSKQEIDLFKNYEFKFNKLDKIKIEAIQLQKLFIKSFLIYKQGFSISGNGKFIELKEFIKTEKIEINRNFIEDLKKFHTHFIENIQNEFSGILKLIDIFSLIQIKTFYITELYRNKNKNDLEKLVIDLLKTTLTNILIYKDGRANQIEAILFKNTKKFLKESNYLDFKNEIFKYDSTSEEYLYQFIKQYELNKNRMMIKHDYPETTRFIKQKRWIVFFNEFIFKQNKKTSKDLEKIFNDEESRKKLFESLSKIIDNS